MLKRYKIHLIAALSISVLLCKHGLSQESENYVIEKVYKTERSVSTTAVDDKSVSIQYFDGLGRPIQAIQLGASPNGKDIVQHIAYDDLGRETKKFLPYSSTQVGGFYSKTAEVEQEAYYAAATVLDGIAPDDDPWSQTFLETSPMNRPLQQGAPGTVWQPIEGSANDNSVHFAYETNVANEIIIFKVDTNNNLLNTGNYQANTLYKNGTRDENEVWSYEYTNSQGQVVLKESDPAGLSLKTYYVYDDFGLLRYVLPPKATDLILVQGITSEILDNLCYYYEYDKRKRMITKKLPGADPVYMVYDERDRLVLSQDGNLRSNNEWMFTKYDALN